MVTTDSVEGIINKLLWFHHDIGNDVLYLRLAALRQTPTVCEETSDALLLLRKEDDDEPVGMTVVNWWKRFGAGSLPDSFARRGDQLERWTSRHPVAA